MCSWVHCLVEHGGVGGGDQLGIEPTQDQNQNIWTSPQAYQKIGDWERGDMTSRPWISHRFFRINYNVSHKETSEMFRIVFSISMTRGIKREKIQI
jgi:hypothetical protein